MRLQLPTSFFVAWLALGPGTGARAQNAAPLALESLAQSPFSRPDGGAAMSSEKTPPHEALQASALSPNPEHFDKAPPARIAERPGARPPGPDARWLEGYWDWDKGRKDFAWVTGTWLVPPPGKFWVNGYWRREPKGWYRVPGFWSGVSPVPKDGQVQEPPRDGRRVGLPLPLPEEPVGMAPGPDYFYIPGEYVPGPSGVVWRAGFWARAQPGWEWNPARWDRWANGWVFREGFWRRAANPPGLPPGVVASTPGGMLVSTPVGFGSHAAGTIWSPLVPSNGLTPRNVSLNTSPGSSAGPGETMTSTRPVEPGAAQLAARGETAGRPAETSQSGQEAGKTSQAGASQKPGDSQSGPQPAPPQQPANPGYGSQPMYPPGRPMMWNARSVVGGFLRRVLP
jgi:hypothetical protein